MSGSQHIDFVCTNSHTYSGTDKPVIVGEFTAAMTDCAYALNGYGVGARYDGTYPNSKFVASCDGMANIATWNATYKADVKNYLYAQLAAFETKAQGWIFWNFKTESAHEWDALVLADNGMWPDLKGGRFTAMC
jgi:glucan 1,3-beta-glucosidase